MFSYESISLSTRLWFVIISKCVYLAPLCFCCTTLRDVILAEQCSASVMSMTCILQHAVVCWVTAQPKTTTPKKPSSVGTPDYPSGIPDMHTIHDPMISVSWIHISELITKLHHPIQYRIIYLQLVTWPSIILPRRASLQISSGYQAASMTHIMPTTL
jgi:hypothetical protein